MRGGGGGDPIIGIKSNNPNLNGVLGNNNILDIKQHFYSLLTTTYCEVGHRKTYTLKIKAQTQSIT